MLIHSYNMEYMGLAVQEQDRQPSPTRAVTRLIGSPSMNS